VLGAGLWYATLGLSLALGAQTPRPAPQTRYRVVLDLTRLENDRLPVIVEVPALNLDTAVYLVPKIVPGTYRIADYGRFVSDVRAFDSEGAQLPVRKLDANRWQVDRARQLQRFEYWIDDTFDDPDTTNGIFGPAGTAFDPDAYLLNLFGVVGFVQGHKDLPYSLEITSPQGLWASTALDRKAFELRSEDKRLDRFSAPNYFEFHDRPLMYARPDTASMRIGTTRIEVGVRSPQGLLNADSVLAECAPVLEAIGTYLQGRLPAELYVILLYTDDPDAATRGAAHLGDYGALEHHTSTAVYMPEYPLEWIGSEIVNIVAHEFLHIVTPLNLHSREIDDFDFDRPEMSEHLWLYEGATEYTSNLVQVRSGLINPEAFFEIISDNLSSAEEFNLYLPMTVMSRYVLDWFEAEYLSVYNRGAVLALSLDLEIRLLTDDRSSLRDVLTQMGKDYGPDRPFDDPALFDEISRRTHPDVRLFFARHVEGAEPLPLQRQLTAYGIDYRAMDSVPSLGFGEVDFDYFEECDCIAVAGINDPSPMSRSLNLQTGDRLVELNGASMRPEQVQQTMTLFYEDLKPGQTVKMVVDRADSKGGFKKVRLKGKAEVYFRLEKHRFVIDPNPTPTERQRRDRWLTEKTL